MTKKNIIIIIGIIILLLLVLASVFYYLSKDSEKTAKLKLETSSGAIVAVNDFHQLPSVLSKETGDVFIEENDKYITFFDDDNQTFYILIMAKPILENRKLAEVDFLKRLDIEKADACKLSVSLGLSLPGSSKQDNQKNYGLSFCPPYDIIPEEAVENEQSINIR